MDSGDSTGSKRSKSWKKRLSGFFRKEKKTKGNEEARKRDEDLSKSKGISKSLQGLPEVKHEEGSSQGTAYKRHSFGRQPLPLSCTHNTCKHNQPHPLLLHAMQLTWMTT